MTARFLTLPMVLLLFSTLIKAQQTTFAGKIVDDRTEKPVRDAIVTIKGTSSWTQSNALGLFEFTGENVAIEVSHVAYETFSAKLSTENPEVQINISPKRHQFNPLVTSDSSQTIEPVKYDSKIWASQVNARQQIDRPVEQIAEFPGGLRQFHSFILYDMHQNHESLGSSFKADVQFSIDQIGSLHLDTVISESGTAIDYFTDLLKNSPRWIPAFQKHKPVKSSYEQSIAYNADSRLWSVVEVLPEHAGGTRGFYQFVAKHLKYPREARKERVQGKVFVQFVVNQDGELEDLQIVRGIGHGCDEEAERIVSLTSGNWTPGRQRGKPVKVRMVLPITFKLGKT